MTTTLCFCSFSSAEPPNHGISLGLIPRVASHARVTTAILGVCTVQYRNDDTVYPE